MGSYKYKVVSHSAISDLDRKALINLYQPIIGPDACSTYLTLVEESEIMSKLSNLTFENSRLMAILNSLDQTIDDNLKRLEGMCLLKRTYSKLKNLFTLQVVKPLSPDKFFNNLVYNNALKNHLDEENYEILKFHYHPSENPVGIIVDCDEEEITATFAEVFPDEVEEMHKEGVENLQEMVGNLMLPSLQDIDLIALQGVLASAGIVPTCLTEEMVAFILDNQTSCNLTDAEIGALLVQAYDQNQKAISFNVFKILLQRELLTIHSATITPSQQKAKEMNLFDSYDYATALLAKEPGLNVKKIIDVLRIDYKLSSGVVNCLLDFSYYKNDGKIVGEYLFKIAKTLNKKHINNTLETMSYLKQAAKYSNSLVSFYSPLHPVAQSSVLGIEKQFAKLPDLSWMNSQKNTKDEQANLDDLDLQLATLDLNF